MGKLNQKISTPPAPKMPDYGGYTDGVKKGSHARGGSLANVKQVSSTDSGGIPNPVQKPNSGLKGKHVGVKNRTFYGD